MSGHSKWRQIKHKKGATDVKRGKVFSKHSKLISTAARGGGDPAMNPALRVAIENARAENMPHDNIERAIKKGTGESKSAVQMEEIMYEGFGPGGVALYIEALTDNKNRALTNIKNIMHKRGGSFGAAGTVGYLFKKQGLIEFVMFDENVEAIELAAIDAGAIDVQQTEGNVMVNTHTQDLIKIKEQLEKLGFIVKSVSVSYVPQTKIHIIDETIANKLSDLIDALEEDEDVTAVYHNAVF